MVAPLRRRPIATPARLRQMTYVLSAALISRKRRHLHRYEAFRRIIRSGLLVNGTFNVEFLCGLMGSNTRGKAHFDDVDSWFDFAGLLGSSALHKGAPRNARCRSLDMVIVTTTRLVEQNRIAVEYPLWVISCR